MINSIRIPVFMSRDGRSSVTVGIPQKARSDPRVRRIVATRPAEHEMQPEHARLLEQLRVAFPPEPIRAAGAFGDWGMTYLDVEPYSQHIEGKTWEALDRAYMITRSDALSFLGTRHLIAVFPVYLRSLLEDSVGSPSVETMIPS